MIFRCIALLLSLALAGCCASGVGCNTTAPGGPVAWDGLGPVPAENTVSGDSGSTPVARAEGKKTRQTATSAARMDSRVQPRDQWEQDQISDQSADAKLNSQLKICRNC